MKQCEICGRYANTERHHVFGGPNRKNSEKWGMVAELCPDCHRTGPGNVTDDHEQSLILKQKYQRIFEEKHSRAEFMKIFGRSYL